MNTRPLDQKNMVTMFKVHNNKLEGEHTGNEAEIIQELFSSLVCNPYAAAHYL